MILDFHVLVFMLSTVIVLLTPGPTNTLLAAAGLGQGLWKALPLIAFELVGYLIAISGWGIFLTSIEQYYPWLSNVVRVACSCYLLFVAVKIWISTGKLPISEEGSIGPATVFMTTMLNPKGLLFASTIFPPHAFDNVQIYLAATVLFMCVVVPIGVAWVALGAVVGNGRMMAMDPFKLQRTVALVIGIFSMTIVWTTVH
ncbi:MAG: multidrug transporter MatE [Nitrospira sp. SG-bin1]|nr:MAG: multidrug transporter MatE [Nitrospira sp. SG-bin1]